METANFIGAAVYVVLVVCTIGCLSLLAGAGACFLFNVDGE
jgi:hypothetical protein